MIKDQMGSVRFKGESPRKSLITLKSPRKRRSRWHCPLGGVLAALCPLVYFLRRRGPFFLAVLHMETVSEFNL